MPLYSDEPPERAASDDSWQWVNDQVVAGIGHDLSDRLSSLYGLIQLAELDGSIGPAVSTPLRSELGRVEELVRLLRLLPGPREERAEPIRLAEVFPTISDLLRRHRGLEGVRLRVEGGADPVVYERWTELVRRILRTISSVAREGGGGEGVGGDRDQAAPGEVIVRLGTGEGVAVVEVEVAGGAVRTLSLPLYGG